MDLTNKILLFVLIVLKESTTTLTTDPEPEHEYEITKHLNEALIKVFQSVHPSSAKQLVSRMRNDGRGKYETYNVQKIHPFSTKIYFRNINVSVWEPESNPKIICDYKKNKVHISNDDLVFNVNGLVDVSLKKTFATFKTIVKFKGVSIAVAEVISSPFNNKLQINFVYNQLLYNQLTLPWLAERFSYHKKEQLITKIKRIIPPMIKDHINRNERFLNIVRSSFCYRPMQKIVTTYPSVLIDEDHYFYSLPKVTFFGVNLVNVKIKGLTNFESLSPNSTFGNSSYTLVVKKVRGSMNLDNREFQNFKFYEMIFNVESLFITVDFETKRLVVECRNYAVMQTSTDPPRVSVFSTAIMHSIEKAIASMLMPALEVPEPNELDDESYTYQPEPSAEETTPELTSKSSPTTRTTKTSPNTRITTQTSPKTELKTTQTRPRTTESSSSLQTTTQTSPKTNATTTQTRPRTTESSTSLRTTTQTSPKTDATTTSPTSDSPALRILTIRPQRFNDKTIKKSTRDNEESPNEKIIKEPSEDLDTNIRNLIARNDTETETNSTEEAEADTYDYDIKFHNVSLKLMPGTPYPKQIQCDLFKDLKIDYHVNAVPGGNIQLGNKGKAISINFHANFTEIKIAVEKLINGSIENETCQYQIYSNQDIKVISPPKKNTTGPNKDLETKTEIDRNVMSMMKERFIRTFKPVVCLPFDFCSQSVQILEDFFQSFVDKVLKKSSLQRNTTLTN